MNYLRFIKFSNLKITLEHITTRYAVNFINETSNNIKASITPHHLILNRTNMLEHKIKPHYYCLPILKREEDRKALLEVAYKKIEIFMGTDSATTILKIKSMNVVVQVFSTQFTLFKY